MAEQEITPPHLYPFAAFLAGRYQCTQIIRVTAGPSDSLRITRQPVRDGELDPARWKAADRLDAAALRRAIIVCEGITDPMLAQLRPWLDAAPAALVTGLRGGNKAEFEALLIRAGLRAEFVGRTAGPDGAKDVPLAVLANTHRPVLDPAPPDFRVVAIMTAYNEGDIIGATLPYLVSQGIEVYLIDNWSTDGTAEIARSFVGRGLIAVEQVPAAPLPYFDLRVLMRRIEQVSRTLDAHWFINYDVDELREAPWPGVTLRDAIYHADRCGFNALDHTVVDFRPVDDGYVPGSDFGAYFQHYEWQNHSGYFRQFKAWKNLGRRVTLARTSGHQAEFAGRRVYPYKFLTRHYTFRSQAQGEQKLREKLARAHPRDQARIQKKFATLQQAPIFVRDPALLRRFDPAEFYDEWLVERLSGVGLVRQASLTWQGRIPPALLPWARRLRALAVRLRG